MVIDGDDEKEGEKESESSRELYIEQRQACVKHFEKWSETQQVEFVEFLLSKMCHYQHGHINSYLKPMLQRDFITALPGKLIMSLWSLIIFTLHISTSTAMPSLLQRMKRCLKLSSSFRSWAWSQNVRKMHVDRSIFLCCDVVVLYAQQLPYLK